MPGTADDRRGVAPDLSPVTLGLASLGSVAATVLVSRFGIAGTLTGAALAPVVVAVVREMGRRPVERVARLPSGARALTRRRPGIRWPLVGTTAAVAFAVAVAAFTVPDLIAGESVVSERPTTFFSPGDGGDGSGAPAGDTGREARTTPEAGTTGTAPTAPTTPTATAPVPAPPGATTTVPAPPLPTAPAEPTAPAPAPESTAPAPDG
jgi:hypothetical protein